MEDVCVNLETAKIIESKKSETSDASALDIDSDSQPISLDPSIAQQLINIQQTLDKLLIEVSGIHTQVDNHSDDIEQLKHYIVMHVV